MKLNFDPESPEPRIETCVLIMVKKIKDNLYLELSNIETKDNYEVQIFTIGGINYENPLYNVQTNLKFKYHDKTYPHDKVVENLRNIFI